MRYRLRLAMLLAILILVVATLGAYAAWRETKTSYGFGVVVEPSGAGTFRLVSASCGETIAGGTGWCGVEVKNESIGEILVEDWSVSSSRSDIALVEDPLYQPCMAYDGYTYLAFNWTPAGDASPGPVMFTVVVTASEGCP